jgi:hypothetical protein
MTLRRLLPALAAGLLAACDAGGNFGASPMAAAVVPGQRGAAPAEANMACIGAGAKAFGRPWQTIVLGGSRPVRQGGYEVQITSGHDRAQAVCTVTGGGRVLRLDPA